MRFKTKTAVLRGGSLAKKLLGLHNAFAKIGLRHFSSNSPEINGDKQRYKALFDPNS
jgi:hypothetical protein